MGLLELIVVGVGLAMDAFAVSVCKGLSMRKMSVKSGAPYVGGVEDILHRDLMIVFLGKQAREGAKDRLTGLFLPSVHTNLPNKWPLLFRREQGGDFDYGQYVRRIIY